MAATIVRVVLSGIVLIDDHVGSQIEDETSPLAELFFKKIGELIFPDELTENNICPDMQRIAANSRSFKSVDGYLRKVLQEVLVGIHCVLIPRRDKLADHHTLRDIELALCIVFASYLIQDIGAFTLRSLDDLALDDRDFNCNRQVHTLVFVSGKVTLNFNKKEAEFQLLAVKNSVSIRQL